MPGTIWFTPDPNEKDFTFLWTTNAAESDTMNTHSSNQHSIQNGLIKPVGIPHIYHLGL